MATLHSIRKSLIKKESLERFWSGLYPYQQDAIQHTMNDVEDNFKGQIILPTGSGNLETKISPVKTSVHFSLSKVSSDIYLALASFSKYVPSPILPV